MTKEEMVGRMLTKLNYKHNLKAYRDSMMKKKKSQIQAVYEVWVKDNHQHTSFYVALLDR